MLHRLTPLLRSNLPHWLELLDRLAPTPEAHPSIAWFVRPADDDVAI